MIFVSMTSNDLLARTSQYQLREHIPLSTSARTTSVDEEEVEQLQSLITAGDAIYGTTTNENRPPSRRGDYSGLSPTQTFYIPNEPPVLPRLRSFFNLESNARNLNNPFPLVDIGDDSTPPPRSVRSPVPLPFTVTTDCDDFSGDEEDESSPATLADRYRRDRLPLSYSSSDDEDIHPPSRLSTYPHDMGPRSRSRKCRRKATPSRIEIVSLDDGNEGDTSAPQDVLAPHATFFIEREKSMVSVKFDPPV